jgi:TRAP-type mannitol/chloroaromatic compound transport system permease small subunit
MDESPTDLIALWEPLAMIALGFILLAIHNVSPLLQLILSVAAGLLLLTAAVTVLVELKDYLKA